MNLADLNPIDKAMVTLGEGSIAADESSRRIKKRSTAIGGAPVTVVEIQN